MLDFIQYRPLYCNTSGGKTHLNQAWLGFPELKRFKLATLEARDHLLQAPPTLLKKLPIQAKAYKCLVQVGFPNDLEAHVSKHFFQFMGADVGRHACLDLTDCFKAMRSLRKHESMQIIKTWCNAWSTSYRYHEPVLFPCLLGCPHMRDELSHYVSCPHVWNVARIAFPHLRLQNLHDRLCVDKPCTESLRVLAATFPAYHTIKPSLGNAPLSFDTARCQFECSFYTAVRAAGLSPDTPAD